MSDSLFLMQYKNSEILYYRSKNIMLNAYRAIWIIQNSSIYTRAKIKKKKKRYKRKNRKTLNLIDIIEPDKKMRFLQSNFFHFSVRVSIINHGISWIKSVTGFTRANGEKEIKRKKKEKDPAMIPFEPSLSNLITTD